MREGEGLADGWAGLRKARRLPVVDLCLPGGRHGPGLVHADPSAVGLVPGRGRILPAAVAAAGRRRPVRVGRLWVIPVARRRTPLLGSRLIVVATVVAVANWRSPLLGSRLVIRLLAASATPLGGGLAVDLAVVDRGRGYVVPAAAAPTAAGAVVEADLPGVRWSGSHGDGGSDGQSRRQHQHHLTREA